MLSATGFTRIDITERGNDIGVIGNKLVVLCIRLARPGWRWRALWSLPLLSMPVMAGFVLAAHVSMALGPGSREDPLGYFVQAVRTGEGKGALAA